MTRNLLRTALLALLALPAAAATISDGIATLNVSDTSGAMLNFVTGGTDHLYEGNYYFRTPSMGLEEALVGSGTTSVTSVTVTSPTEITVLGGTADFDFELTYALSGSGILVPSLELTNTTGSQLDLALFSYQDWDVDGSFTDDTVVWDGSRIIQSEITPLYITPFQTPDAVEASVYSTLYDELEDGNVDNLTDGAGLPFGPGDGTFVFQFDLSLAPTGTTTIVYAVPEPSSGALATLGLLALAWLGRNRRPPRS
jgi:uncharacterized protein (TIGR03382 family)